MQLAEDDQRREKPIEVGALAKDLWFKLIQLKYKKKENGAFLSEFTGKVHGIWALQKDLLPEGGASVTRAPATARPAGPHLGELRSQTGAGGPRGRREGRRRSSRGRGACSLEGPEPEFQASAETPGHGGRTCAPAAGAESVQRSRPGLANPGNPRKTVKEVRY